MLKLKQQRMVIRIRREFAKVDCAIGGVGNQEVCGQGAAVLRIFILRVQVQEVGAWSDWIDVPLIEQMAAKRSGVSRGEKIRPNPAFDAQVKVINLLLVRSGRDGIHGSGRRQKRTGGRRRYAGETPVVCCRRVNRWWIRGKIHDRVAFDSVIVDAAAAANRGVAVFERVPGKSKPRPHRDGRVGEKSVWHASLSTNDHSIRGIAN